MASKTSLNTYNFTNGINLAALVAKRAESLLLGNGYDIKKLEGATEADLKLVTDIHKDQNLIGLLSDVERNLSMYGEQGVIVDYDGNNNIRYSMPSQQSKYYTTTSGKLIGARTFRQVSWGEGVYEVQEVWSLNKPVKRTIRNNKGVYIPIADFNASLTPELQVVEDWNFSKLGRIPIILFQNLNSIGNKSEPDGKHVAIIQSQLDHALQTLYKETEMTRTRYGIDSGNEELVKLVKQSGLGNVMQDSVMMTDSDYGEDGYHKPIEVITSEFKGMEYQNIVDYYQDLYFDGAGYSTLSDSKAETTVVGTMFTNRKDMETTRKKLKIREAQLEDFQELVKDMAGITSNFAIKLKTNILFDEQSRMDYIRTGEELGVVTLEDKISLFYAITDEEEIAAKKELLEKEEEERMKKINEELEAGQEDDMEDNSEEGSDNDESD